MLGSKLAKKLKQAGFPQKGLKIPSYYPELSELIEECGHSFLSLSRVPIKQYPSEELVLSWVASSIKSGDFIGDSFEDAVANLLLKIYENKNKSKK